jgi:hypothetical protein
MFLSPSVIFVCSLHDINIYLNSINDFILMSHFCQNPVISILGDPSNSNQLRPRSHSGAAWKVTWISPPAICFNWCNLPWRWQFFATNICDKMTKVLCLLIENCASTYPGNDMKSMLDKNCVYTINYIWQLCIYYIWLVVLTILKNMSSSMGRMTSHIYIYTYYGK